MYIYIIYIYICIYIFISIYLYTHAIFRNYMSNCRDYYILDDDLGGLGRAMCTVPMCLVGCHQPSEQQGRLRGCLQASF